MSKYKFVVFATTLFGLLIGPVGLAQDGSTGTPPSEGTSDDPCTKAIKNLEGGKDINGQPLKNGDTLDHYVALAILDACKIRVSATKGRIKPNHCKDKDGNKVSGCTSLKDVKKDTVLGVVKLDQAVREWHSKQAPNSKCASGRLVISGATEVGHSTKGTYNHGNGYKLDFGFGSSPTNKNCLSEYLYSNWKFDGFRVIKGDLAADKISTETVTTIEEKDKTKTDIKGFCKNGTTVKYMPTGGIPAGAKKKSAKILILGSHDGIRMVSGDGKVNAVLEQSHEHWDITFQGPDISSSGGSNSVTLPPKPCGKTP